MEVASPSSANNNHQTFHSSQKAPTHVAIAVCGCGNDGRLGLGSFDSQDRITLLPFFFSGERESNNQDVGDGDKYDGRSFGNILAVRVGGYHNFVITTTGVYGWGLNENGQLGLGRGSAACVSVPTRIPFFDGSFVIDIECGAYHTVAWTTKGLFACGKNDDGQLGLPSEMDYLSFTTVLTATQVNNVATGGEEEGECQLIQRGQLTHISCGTHHTLLAFRDVVVATKDGDEALSQEYPLLITAAGKGDFGELGYDGDMWSVLQAKAKTLQSALHAEMRQQRQPQETDFVASTQSFLEKKWKPLKQRRALFSSPHFQPVGLPILAEQTAGLDGCSYEVVSLHAMHLHSAVVLRESARKTGGADAGRMRIFHWGCYYCNAIEDDASSIPREVEMEGVLLHAGNEALFRYAAPTIANSISSRLGAAVEVMGSGAIGLGEDDSFVTEWAPLPLPQEANGLCVQKMTGREHYFILFENTLVVGFGDNMHGQVGVKEGEDVVLRPTTVLRAGDCIRSPTPDGAKSLWTVEAIRDVACGVRHSVCLVEVRPASLLDAPSSLND